MALPVTIVFHLILHWQELVQQIPIPLMEMYQYQVWDLMVYLLLILILSGKQPRCLMLD